MPILDLIGNALTTWVEVKGSPEIEEDASGAEVRRKYRVAVGSIGTNLPAFGTADADYPTALLRRYAVSGPKSAPEVTCIFRTNNDVSPGPVNPVGTVVRRADSAAEQIPIEQHPNFESRRIDETTGAEYVTLDGTEYVGIESFLAPRPVYSYTETVSASGFDFDEETIIGDVGTLVTPPHMDGTPTAGKWLQTARQIEERGSVVDVSESFQYHPDGWNADVYS